MIILLKELKYLRKPRKEDIVYRKRQINTFTENIKKYLDDSSYRFHGCSFITAEKIISDKFIGLGCGSFAVSDISSIDTTIQNFSDLNMGTRNYCLPAGCIFILKPKDEEDTKLIRILRMCDIDFNNNPNQLCGIITTPENVEKVKTMLVKSNLNNCPVYDYDSYISILKQNSMKDGNFTSNILMKKIDKNR